MQWVVWLLGLALVVEGRIEEKMEEMVRMEVEEEKVERCLVDEPLPDDKFISQNSEEQVIRLLVSQRPPSR